MKIKTSEIFLILGILFFAALLLSNFLSEYKLSKRSTFEKPKVLEKQEKKEEIKTFTPHSENIPQESAQINIEKTYQEPFKIKVQQNWENTPPYVSAEKIRQEAVQLKYEKERERTRYEKIGIK